MILEWTSIQSSWRASKEVVTCITLSAVPWSTMFGSRPLEDESWRWKQERAAASDLGRGTHIGSGAQRLVDKVNGKSVAALRSLGRSLCHLCGARVSNLDWPARTPWHQRLQSSLPQPLRGQRMKRETISGLYCPALILVRMISVSTRIRFASWRRYVLQRTKECWHQDWQCFAKGQPGVRWKLYPLQILPILPQVSRVFFKLCRAGKKQPSSKPLSSLRRRSTRWCNETTKPPTVLSTDWKWPFTRSERRLLWNKWRPSSCWDRVLCPQRTKGRSSRWSMVISRPRKWNRLCDHWQREFWPAIRRSPRRRSTLSTMWNLKHLLSSQIPILLQHLWLTGQW